MIIIEMIYMIFFSMLTVFEGESRVGENPVSSQPDFNQTDGNHFYGGNSLLYKTWSLIFFGLFLTSDATLSNDIEALSLESVIIEG